MPSLLRLLLCLSLLLATPHARKQRHSGSLVNVLGSDDDDDDKTDDGDETLAMQHAQRIAEAGSCEAPKPQVLHINDFYPYPGKYYLPHCTLLHRCGKHAGCCGTERLRCVAASKQKVTLHFYSVQVVGRGLPAVRSIEKLVFVNHTRCGCVPNEHLDL